MAVQRIHQMSGYAANGPVCSRYRNENERKFQLTRTSQFSNRNAYRRNSSGRVSNRTKQCDRDINSSDKSYDDVDIQIARFYGVIYTMMGLVAVLAAAL